MFICHHSRRRKSGSWLLCAALAAFAIFPTISYAADTETAVFAGGCFWCMQPPYDKLKGVLKTEVGYAGGSEENAKYSRVSANLTQHVEAIRVYYDPQKISYKSLLSVFWRNIDPTVTNRQFCDVGPQYRSVIYFRNKTEQKLAERSSKSLAKRYGFTIKTEIVPLTTFFIAEEYHQNYYINNPVRYKSYRFLCGRDQRLKQLYGDSHD